MVTIYIDGTPIDFLADSGAGHTVVAEGAFPKRPRMSGRYLESINASGGTTKEQFTTPLKVEIPGLAPIKHSVLLSKVCPISLAGRDILMCFNLAVIPTNEGMKIEHMSNLATPPKQHGTFVKYDKVVPLYEYRWSLCRNSPVGRELLEQAHMHIHKQADVMTEHELHCTAHVHEGRDSGYDETWEGVQSDGEVLEGDRLFWQGERCAVTVEPTDLKSYQIKGSVPHIPLTKNKTDQWLDLGPWVKTCANIPDKMWYGCIEHGNNVEKYDPQDGADPTFRIAFKRKICVNKEFVLTKSGEGNKKEDGSLWGHLNCSSSAIQALERLPDDLWARSKFDCGLVKSASPIVVTPKTSYRPCVKQYPIKSEAIEGIRPVFESFLRDGIIVELPEGSPVRTPIFPIKKIRGPNEPVEWRFVQDLKAVNAAVEKIAPIVPDPYTILSGIKPSAKWFSLIDINNAFFSIPIAPDSQYWFAFEFERKQYTWSRMCQGYSNSPTHYNMALANDLADFETTGETSILQYVDDILVASSTEQECVENTIALLQHLYKGGHKISRKKLRIAQREVKFLGHIINGEGKQLSKDRIQSILDLPKPVTVKQGRSFLGMTSYCRMFIANYSELEAPLRDMINKCPNGTQLPWSDVATAAFEELKHTLTQAPCLGIPRHDKPYIQYVDQKNGHMTSVLLQEHGKRLRPVGYFSCKLNPVERGLPFCLQAVAAAELAVLASRQLVGYGDLTLFVPHAVSHLLLEKKTAHLSASRWLRYHNILLCLPNVTVKRCTTLNPSTLMPTPEDGEEHHDCVQTVATVCTPRVDLKEDPLPNPDLEFFTDGSASRDDKGVNCVGFAVVTDHETVTSGRLPPHYSSQMAELVALTEACKAAKGKTANIFVDSRYCWGITHDFGAMWKMRGYLTSSGKRIRHYELVNQLLEAICLPKEIAVIKCEAHTGKKDRIALGNARADMISKEAAQQAQEGIFLQEENNRGQLTDETWLQDMYSNHATAQDTTEWERAGCKKIGGVWRSEDGRPCLPKALFPWYAKLAHGLDHVSKAGIVASITKHWYTKGFTPVAQRWCEQCLICARNNISRPIKPVAQAAHPPPQNPGDHLMMDFIELTPSEGKNMC